VKFKCYDHECSQAEVCALHREGEPGPDEKWMKSLFPYDIPLDRVCPNFEPKKKDPYP